MLFKKIDKLNYKQLIIYLMQLQLPMIKEEKVLLLKNKLRIQKKMQKKEVKVVNNKLV